MDLMRCEVCKRYCNWDNSVGKEKYIVCNECCNAVSEKFKQTAEKRFGINPVIAQLVPLEIFFMLSDIREDDED